MPYSASFWIHLMTYSPFLTRRIERRFHSDHCDCPYRSLAGKTQAMLRRGDVRNPTWLAVGRFHVLVHRDAPTAPTLTYTRPAIFKSNPEGRPAQAIPSA